MTAGATIAGGGSGSVTVTSDSFSGTTGVVERMVGNAPVTAEGGLATAVGKGIAGSRDMSWER